MLIELFGVKDITLAERLVKPWLLATSHKSTLLVLILECSGRIRIEEVVSLASLFELIFL